MMTIVVNAPLVPKATVGLENKHLLDDVLWGRLTRRIVKEHGVDLPLAERIMDQALGFLKLCAEEPRGSYGPSELVDIGWHMFILYTREYAAFCEGLAGRFIHHSPFDMPGVDYTGTHGSWTTVEAMRAHGISVDEPLWICVSAKCTGCNYCGGGDPEEPPKCRQQMDEMVGRANKCTTECENGGSDTNCGFV